MEDSLAMSIVLALLFFGVSLAYSSVGLGGGSAYTALMAIFGVSHVMIPTTSLTLPKEVFYWVLMISLTLVAVRIYGWDHVSLKLELGKMQRIVLSMVIGAILGLVAGIVGIGGGVYLVPLIIVFDLGSPKEAAAAGAIFIWVNSCAGLVARLQHHPLDPVAFAPLIVAVALGGSLGSYMGASKLKPRTMEKILGMIIVVAIVFLAQRVLF